MGSELELMKEIRNSHALKPDTVKEQEEDYVEVCTRETMEREAQLAEKSASTITHKRRGRPKKVPEADKKEITQVEKLEPTKPLKTLKTLKTHVVRESRKPNNTRKQHKETNTMKVKKTRKRAAVANEAPETLPFAGQQMYTVTVVGGISIPGFKLKQGEKLAIAKLIPVKVN